MVSGPAQAGLKDKSASRPALKKKILIALSVPFLPEYIRFAMTAALSSQNFNIAQYRSISLKPQSVVSGLSSRRPGTAKAAGKGRLRQIFIFLRLCL
jgi:hypothetical protein